jgi:hypothetical protein
METVSLADSGTRPTSVMGKLSTGMRGRAARQGLTLAHFKAQLDDIRDTTLTLELNLSTFGTHPRAPLGHVGDRVSLS